PRVAQSGRTTIRMRSARRAVFPALCLFLVLALPASAATLVPPGNRSAAQPAVPSGSASRTQAMKTTYEQKYRRVLEFLRNDAQLRDKIARTARRYGIDPVHMAGAIIGEHTYNVDVYDRLQTYY